MQLSVEHTTFLILLSCLRKVFKDSNKRAWMLERLIGHSQIWQFIPSGPLQVYLVSFVASDLISSTPILLPLPQLSISFVKFAFRQSGQQIGSTLDTSPSLSRHWDEGDDTFEWMTPYNLFSHHYFGTALPSWGRWLLQAYVLDVTISWQYPFTT